MKLTPEQQAMLNGEKGETMAKVVKTLVMYGDAFGAERMVPVEIRPHGHQLRPEGNEARVRSVSGNHRRRACFRPEIHGRPEAAGQARPQQPDRRPCVQKIHVHISGQLRAAAQAVGHHQ